MRLAGLRSRSARPASSLRVLARRWRFHSCNFTENFFVPPETHHAPSQKKRQEAAPFRGAEECRAAFGLHQSLVCATLQYMKLIAQLKLIPSPEQADALKRTLEAANAACNYISDVAWNTRTFGKFALQRLCYQHVREQFGLSAQ